MFITKVLVITFVMLNIEVFLLFCLDKDCEQFVWLQTKSFRKGKNFNIHNMVSLLNGAF